MAEVLSQSQIDALLNSMANGDDGAADTKPKKPKEEYAKYDFSSPKKYTKDKLKMLHNIYDNYARVVTSQINGLFRVASEVEVIGVDEQRYYEFANALSETDIMTLTRVSLPDHSKNPPMVFYIEPSIMGAMIDRMLGGPGNDKTVGMSYEYTDVELALYERIIKYPIAVTPDIWAGYIKFGIEFERIEENPSMFQGIGVDETVVIIMMTIQMGEIQGTMSVCIPGTLLMNIFDIVDKTKHLSDQDDMELMKSTRDNIFERIKDSRIDVMAQLGVANLNLDDVYNLHVGDVIDLNKPQDSPVSLHIEGQPWFTGQLGVHNKNIAVKIEERVDRAKENIAV